MPAQSTLRKHFSAGPGRCVALIALTATVWLGAAGSRANAQSTSATPGELRQAFEGLVEVSEVLLDVLVTDNEGQGVSGLELEDFVVEEDGQPVELTSVSYYSTRYGDPGASPDAVPESRYFILFFHDQSRYGAYGMRLVKQQRQAAAALQRWVMESMLPGDWAAVASYDERLQLHQDFTQNRDALLRGVEYAFTGVSPESVPPSKRRPSGGNEPSLARHLPEGRDMKRSRRSVYEGLRMLAEASGFTVGRKNLVLFTLGFGIEHGNARISRPDPRYYPKLEAELNDHNVAVYPLDLTPPVFENNQRRFLNQLAADTGGTFIHQPGHFFEPLEQLSWENAGYYLISFRSEHPAGDTGYQRVRVQLRDPSLNVRARQGYRYGR